MRSHLLQAETEHCVARWR